MRSKRDTRFAFSIIVFFCITVTNAQSISQSYEVRYFSNDTKANGETDFKGQTTTLNTDQRITLLKYYADEVSDFFNDKELNSKVATDDEVAQLLKSMKPQPLPKVRKRIPLNNWRWLGYRTGEYEQSIFELEKFRGSENVLAANGTVSFTGKTNWLGYAYDGSNWNWQYAPQTWRFGMSWRAMFKEKNDSAKFLIYHKGTDKALITVGADGKGNLYCKSAGKVITATPFETNKWYNFKIEADLDAPDKKQRYNLYIDGELIADYIAVEEEMSEVNSFKICDASSLVFDDLYGVGYHRNKMASWPFYAKTFIDNNFNIKPHIQGWQSVYYDDSQWGTTNLPFVIGSERHEGESLYLRKKVKVGDAENAFLNIETLTPSGEVWVNGELAAVYKDQHPIRLDITRYIKEHSENTIGIKVDPLYISRDIGFLTGHGTMDRNPGWFAGRVTLDLVAATSVKNAFVYTAKLGDGDAMLHAKVELHHKGTTSFRGKVLVKMSAWNNSEAATAEKVAEIPVLMGNGVKTFDVDFTVKNPKLWSPESPDMYKFTLNVEDKNETLVDDYVLTTGIRTVSQKDGNFHLNGKPAMLNGAQNMGFRGTEMEELVTWVLCPPDEWVAKELLMIKNMNGNLLRMHVHGWEAKAWNVNDPRFCEIADQLGVMLIWTTPAWIRNSNGGWGVFDFEGFPKYIKQVQNHPSIVMWEASNHPWGLRDGPDETNLFMEKSYNAIYPYDPSRIISISSHIHCLNLSNPPEIWNSPLVTRGNQDSITGYGNEWSSLRNWDKSELRSKTHAYFNFEQEESIGQHNWNLCKGKPWYYIMSYEWEYDEGSIGRRLTQEEWRESQGWQAFSAYESMKKQRILDYDGFSWCCLHSGSNSGTYMKPLIDHTDHAKLAYHIHKTIFQNVLAGSNNVDIVYGPEDQITPVILNLGDEKLVKLTVVLKDKFNGKQIDKKVYRDVQLPAGRSKTELDAFKPKLIKEGLYFIEYIVE